MNGSFGVLMKVVCMVLVSLTLAGVARAGWDDLKPGMDQKAVYQCVGQPLLLNRGRGLEIWTYDRGGYIQFELGRVSYWASSKPVVAAPAAAAVAAKPAAAPAQVKQPAPARRNIIAQG